jgi:hypothetical protein
MEDQLLDGRAAAAMSTKLTRTNLTRSSSDILGSGARTAGFKRRARSFFDIQNLFRPCAVALSFRAPAGARPLALRLFTLCRNPQVDGPANLRRNRRVGPGLNPPQRGQLFRLEENLESRFG